MIILNSPETTLEFKIDKAPAKGYILAAIL
jgi:hypothetical protein